ncbi:AGRG2-like protein, partial [Mya arenaria]
VKNNNSSTMINFEEFRLSRRPMKELCQESLRNSEISHILSELVYLIQTFVVRCSVAEFVHNLWLRMNIVDIYENNIADFRETGIRDILGLSKITMCPHGFMLLVSLMPFPSLLSLRAQTAPLPPWQDDLTWGDYDPFRALKYDSGTCAYRRTCGNGLTYPDKNCHCDKLCVIMNDCCDGFITQQPFESNFLVLNTDQFSCERVYGLTKNVNSYGVLLVSKCSPNWSEARTKSLCESDFQLEEDLMKKTPVSGGSYLQIMYKNMYCAYCNFEYDILFWSPQYECYENITNVRRIPDSPDCRLSFTAPMYNSTTRKCGLFPPISTCENNSEKELIGLCEQGYYNIVYDMYGTMYRNEHCAQCNKVDMNALYCEILKPMDLPPNPTETPDGRKASLRLLVDLNLNTAYKDGEIINSRQCSNDEIYDIVHDKCREVFCPPTTFPRKGRCIPDTLNINVHEVDHMQQYSDLYNCTWAKLDPAEYIFTNDSKLFILSTQETYNESQFHQNGTDVFICHSINKTCVQCHSVHVTFNFDESEVYLSTIGLFSAASQYSRKDSYMFGGISFASTIVFLNFFRSVFLSFSMQNTGNMRSLFLFGSLLLDEHNRIRFVENFLSFYGWVIPLIIVGVALILEFGQFDGIDTSMKPYYGRKICWITSRNSLILFFLGPLALFKLFDMTSFIFTAVHIARARKQGAAARRKKNTCSLLINIKLSLVMGLTWVFAFVANVANLQFMWYFFIIFNTLQGLFIAISFLCTRKVGRLLHEKYEVFSSTFNSRQSTADTPMTSASKSTSK